MGAGSDGLKHYMVWPYFSGITLAFQKIISGRARKKKYFPENVQNSTSERERETSERGIKREQLDSPSSYFNW